MIDKEENNSLNASAAGQGTEYFKIGKLVSVFSLKGELTLQHSLGKKTSLKGLQALFIEEQKGSFIPYFIEATRIKSDTEIYIKVEGIDIREKAAKLVQKEAWLREDDFKKFSSKSAPISFLGFEVIDDQKPLGKILEVIEQPHQVLCRLEIDGKEVLIPLHENTIEKVDLKKRQITVQLPEGLLDIYLG